jgi:hypothetical protein
MNKLKAEKQVARDGETWQAYRKRVEAPPKIWRVFQLVLG